jgi:hypothetical protein
LRGVEDRQRDQALEARTAEQEAIDELAAIRHTGGRHDHDVVVFAGHVVALLHVGGGPESGAELGVVLGGLPLQRHEHDGQQRAGRRLRVDYRHPTGDQAGCVVAGDASMDGAGRQADVIAELAQRTSGIALEQVQQINVDCVERKGPRHAMTSRVSANDFNRVAREAP